MVRPFRRGLFSRVTLAAGPALDPQTLTLDGLRDAVAGLIEATPAAPDATRAAAGPGRP
jgi:hypothetical protein